MSPMRKLHRVRYFFTKFTDADPEIPYEINMTFCKHTIRCILIGVEIVLNSRIPPQPKPGRAKNVSLSAICSGAAPAPI